MNELLGLYVHVPFCRARCGYCSFSISTHGERTGEFLATLDREISWRSDRYGGREVDTVYFGGGTPSALPDENLAAILDELARRFRIREGAEITLEANPDDLPDGRAARLSALGITRLSVGVQTFEDRELRALDRLHDSDRARRALGDALEAGVLVNADLMVGTPVQSDRTFFSSIETLLELGIGHASVYVLETDKPSKLSREVRERRADVAEDDVVASRFLEGAGQLERAGLRRYEVSNFARAGEESRHNLRYWRRRPYLGLGPSAASFVDGERFENAWSLAEWLRGGGASERERIPVSPEDALREEISLGLRELSGIPESLVERTDRELPRSEFGSKLREGVELGDVVRSGGRIAFTATGWLRMNLYLCELY